MMGKVTFSFGVPCYDAYDKKTGKVILRPFTANSRICVNRTNDRVAGWCNSCHAHGNDELRVEIFELRVGHSLTRLCYPCVAELRRGLALEYTESTMDKKIAARAR